MVVWSASRPRSRSSSSTSRNESEYRRYQRTAQRISSGSVCRHLKIAGRIAFFTICSGYQPPLAEVATQPCGFIPRSLIIWDKGHIVIGRGHYHWRHETCWYAVKKGAQANWKGDRKASTLWEIDNPRKSETGHSAQKPVECMQRAIHNHKGDVYDPFVGSGTTIIAGEREGRSVYAIEIEPVYVDVAVTRWEEFTGKKAVRQK